MADGLKVTIDGTTLRVEAPYDSLPLVDLPDPAADVEVGPSQASTTGSGP